MGVNNHRPEIKARTAERMRYILDLRLQGAEFADIGRQIGITEQAANKLYWRALDRIPAPLVEATRKEHIRRLNGLRVKFYNELMKAEGIDRVAVGALLLKFEQREAKLLGLDAAIKVEQTNIEDPAVAARRERQMEILGKLTLEERQELLASFAASEKSDVGNTGELDK